MPSFVDWSERMDGLLKNNYDETANIIRLAEQTSLKKSPIDGS